MYGSYFEPFKSSSLSAMNSPKARLYLVWIHTIFTFLLFNMLVHLYYLKNMGNKENGKIKALTWWDGSWGEIVS